MNICVLGAGNWGTTAALLLHGNGHRVSLWEYNEKLARDMLEHRENRTYLPGVAIPDDLRVDWRIGELTGDADVVIFVVPSSVMRATAKALADTGVLPESSILVSLSKGLEHGSLETMTAVIGEELPGRSLVAMSGPCIAAEVARKQPTTIVAASESESAATLVQDLFMAPYFRVYTSDDPLGVQLGGAVKNIIAIAAGMNDGLGFGSNAKSALVTRGIVELKRFADSLGAQPETFNGLSGIGDLITTCFSSHSRNRHVGEQLAKGRSLEDIEREMVMIAEGVPTTKTVYDHIGEHGIDMPIVDTVYRVLFEGLAPEEAVSDLMQRERKAE